MEKAAAALLSTLLILSAAGTAAGAKPVDVEVVDLGTLGGSSGGARDINGLGEAAGGSSLPDGSGRPFFWSVSTGMIDVGGGPGGEPGFAMDIGEGGHVAGRHEMGYRWFGNRKRALYSSFVWSLSTGQTVIPAAEGALSVDVWAVNSLGHAVGTFLFPTGPYGSDYIFHPFLWDGATVTDLMTLFPEGLSAASASAINDAGEIVGAAMREDGTGGAYRWSAAAGFEFLGAIPKATGSTAVAINIPAEAAGSSSLPVPSWDIIPSRATVWGVDGKAEDLGILGDYASYALDINDRGEVTGWSTVDSADGLYEAHAFFWSPATGMVDLGTLGGDDSYGDGVNNHGQVVGQSENADGEYHAFLWSMATGMVDLGTLGGRNSRAWEINDRGEAAGYASTADWQSHAVLWRVPVPEAGSCSIAVLAALVEGLVNREVLNGGQGTSLLAKVDTAAKKMGRPATAVNILGAFIHEVEALVQGGTLPGPDGEELAAAAGEVISCLGY